MTTLYPGDNGDQSFYESKDHSKLIFQNHEEMHWFAMKTEPTHKIIGFEYCKNEAAKLIDSTISEDYQWIKRGTLWELQPQLHQEIQELYPTFNTQATEILRDLGRETYEQLGIYNIMTCQNGIVFSIKSSPSIEKIKIALFGNTYHFIFQKNKHFIEVNNVPKEKLHQTIEDYTKLILSPHT